ncbi:MAG TPA: pilus assembly protein PilM [Candidatus Omnitrophota bacterium]|nr:pilus assembly protein PilM [Candidatus Omnitrophota bacterium]
MNPGEIKKGKSIVVYIGGRRIVAILGSTDAAVPSVLRFQERKFPDGLTNGLVTNLQNATNSIEKALSDLAPITELEKTPVYVVLGNASLRQHRFESSQYYSSTRTVTAEDVRAVIQQTRSVATLPLAETVLTAVPESFVVNDMAGVKNPIDLEAQRLGAQVQLFSMDYQSLRNIVKIFEGLDLEVKGFFPKTLTVSEAVLKPEHKQNGSVVIDISDRTTEVMVWKDQKLVASKFLSIGGAWLTEKISARYKLDPVAAENLKEKYGSVENEFKSEELIPLWSKSEQSREMIKRGDFQTVWLTLVKEWMTLIQGEVEQILSEARIFHPDIFFTGGPVQMDGFLEWMQREFGVEGKIGLSHQLDTTPEILRSPIWVPALGMLHWIDYFKRDLEPLYVPRGVVEKSILTAKTWFANYF